MNPADGAHTVGRWLCDRAAVSPLRIAIDDRGVTTTYAALCARATRLSRAWTDAGYGPGMRVATVSGNSTEHVVAFFACAMVGMAFIPLSWRLTPLELADLIARAEPHLVLIDDEHDALASTALRHLGEAAPISAGLGMTGVESAVPAPTVPVAQGPVRDEDPLLVIFTSGSEAAPKGVVLSHQNCFWNNLALNQAMPMRPDDVVLSVLPQYHIAAWNVQPLLAWWTGATVVLERSFDPGRVLQLIAERGVTTMMGVPTQYRMLCSSPLWPDADLSSLRRVVVGGATIPAALATDWTTRGVPLAQGYGLTEAGPNVLYLDASESAANPGAVGRPYPSVSVRLVDPVTGLELQGPATGELQVRGPSVFTEYLADAEATARALEGGWLATGDLMRRDARGVHHVVDRLKDIFVSGGENVAPAEVERALCEHPLVEACAVVGVPDPVWGERGAAFVVAAGPLSADELLTFARERLAGFKIPVLVEFVDELPRSTIEKIARPQLRLRAQELITEGDANGRHH